MPPAISSPNAFTTSLSCCDDALFVRQLAYIFDDKPNFFVIVGDNAKREISSPTFADCVF